MNAIEENIYTDSWKAIGKSISVADEVRAGPGVPDEKLVRQHVALHQVAASAGGDDVAGSVGPAL